MSFVHLHVHTEYSLLDGMGGAKDIVERAAALGQNAVGITDHGVMFGAVDFYSAAEKAGIKPVIGMEAYLANRTRFDKDQADRKPYHMLLLARDNVGYANLSKLATVAQLEGYYYRPRIDREIMSEYSGGLIATSGCLASEIPQLILAGRNDEAKTKIAWYEEVFGVGNFYLELQPHDLPDLKVVNNWLVDYRQSGHTHAPLLATNDVHYVQHGDADIHDTLLAIQTGKNKSDGNRMKLTPSGSYYLKSHDQMWGGLSSMGLPEWAIRESIASTVEVSGKCNVELTFGKYHLPNYPVPDGFKDAKAFLAYLVWKGLSWRFDGHESDEVLVNRIETELSVIDNMGFNTYFLIVWDLCEFARYSDIWWNVRGSGAGSLVAYCLGITNVDPIQNSLLFERFLNHGRVSMPDIDIDYPDDKRADMIAYAVKRYGEENVAGIITFGRMGAKAAIRDAGRALGVPLDAVNKVAAQLPKVGAGNVSDYVETPAVSELARENKAVSAMMDTANAIQGGVRHVSTHAAGIVITGQPVSDYVPLHRNAGKDGIPMTQYPMETVESLGLLKVDFLGLSTLSVLRRVCALVEARGVRYTIDNIPYRFDNPHAPLNDDERVRLKETFEMIGRGETVGVFQLENDGMQSMLKNMQPKGFGDIVAGVSLYRPGPMDFIPDYVRRLHGEPFDYSHLLLNTNASPEVLNILTEKMGAILDETYGIIVYQEQIIQIASDVFSYSLSEADLMRRAVSKKKEKDLLLHRSTFRERGALVGIPSDVSDNIFDEIQKFANYGFNRSHGTDYAMLTVQTAYMKCCYPQEFMVALLESHINKPDKITAFIAECKRLGIQVLPPDINKSLPSFAIEGSNIRYGLTGIKNVTDSTAAVIIAERGRGVFTSVIDFFKRMTGLNKTVVESLVRVGCFDDLMERHALYENIEGLVKYYKKGGASQTGQLSLFGDYTEYNFVQAENKGAKDYLRWERELLGVYLSARPTDRYWQELFDHHVNSLAFLSDDEPDFPPFVAACGEVLVFKDVTTKRGHKMAIMTVEDWHSGNTVDVVFFPDAWAAVSPKVAGWQTRGIIPKQTLSVGDVIIFTGAFEDNRGNYNIVGRDLWHISDIGSLPVFNYGTNQPLSKPQNKGTKMTGKKHCTITYKTGDFEKDKKALRDIVAAFALWQGNDTFSIVLHGETRSDEMVFPGKTTNLSPENIGLLQDVVGRDNVLIV